MVKLKIGDNNMNITIIGAGAYGLSLAKRFNDNNNKVIVYSKVKEEIDELNKTNMNKKALGNYQMPSGILYTKDVKQALNDAIIVVLAVATKYLKSTCEHIKPYIKNSHILIASKGIDEETNLFASMLVYKVLKTKKIATISGPSFAKDMINDNLIGLSLASTKQQTKQAIIKALENNLLKIRSTNDFIGLELCGTMKNVIAITSGMLEGLHSSESTKAMFLTESLNDIRLLIRKLNGNEKTILSYAGFGDILLTCTSNSSRNYAFGKMIGEKKSKEEKEKYLSENTVEGVYTLKSIYGLIKNKKVDLPIINVVYDIVFGYKEPAYIYEFLRNK